MGNDIGLGRQVVAAFVRGVFFGAGFSLAAIATYWIALPIMMSRTEASFDTKNNGAEADSQSKRIILSDVEEKKENGQDWIIGAAKNEGPKQVSSVTIGADLFNHGKFVDKYSTYVSGGLAPGQSRYFKISCGCKDSQPAEHDSFKVEVVREF